ncbi:MAG TPA: helix-turn-helix transcriptional regulator [Vicinamibacterales bacterium]|nr:helix-turn-helix transcriptional regulator [Vicinamibacterales bacterium]
MAASSAPIGEFEQLVLLALLRLGDQAYGIPITEEIQRRAKRDVALASVYKALDRLEQKGLVASSLGPSTAARGGRRKKYFRLQPAGLQALKASIRAIRNLASGLAYQLDPLEEE